MITENKNLGVCGAEIESTKIFSENHYTKAGIIGAYSDFKARYPLIRLSGKEPPDKAWQKTEWEPLTTEADLPGNFGVVLQADDLVIDADLYKGTDAYTRLCERFGVDESKTYTVETGRGGRHVYLKKSPEIKIRKTHPDFPGIEFLSKGAQVVAPFSIHPDNQQPYKVMCGSPLEVAHVSPTLVDFLKHRESPENVVENYQDDDVTQIRYADWLAKTARIAVQGDNGSSLTISTAHRGRDMGLSPEVTCDLMAEHWNPRCLPPWSESELESIVNRAYACATKPAGNLHPAADFEVVEAPPDAPAASRSLITGSDLLDTDFPPMVFIVESILPAGLIVLASPPKLGKSWLCLNLGVAVATGGQALGRFSTEKGEVFYYCLEDGQRRIKERLLRMGCTRDDLKNIHFSTSHPPLDTAGIKQLEAQIQASPKCRLIIFDTWGRLEPESKGNQDAYQRATKAAAPLQTLALKYNVAIILVTHLKKQETSDPLHQISGSIALAAVADASMLLKRKRSEGKGSLYLTGRDLSEETYSLSFDASQGRWTAIGKAGEINASQERQEITQAIIEADVPMTPKEVAATLEKPVGAIRKTMSRMCDSGQLVKTERGKYRPATAADDFDG